MKRVTSILLLILVLSCSLFMIVSCGDDEEGDVTTTSGQNANKQVPVYQGMTISSASSSVMSTGAIKLSFASHEVGDKHHGHPKPGEFKGDFDGRNDAVDEAKPFPENGEDETIEEEIKSSLNVVGSPDTIYYATPGEDIYINIHIDNPDSFEIMSFTLNGKKYSSYMFEEGSDMETIVLKYNVDDAAGIVEYTIDAIKYIDGTEIKDVLIDGNKTVMAGIKTENQVAANVTNVKIGTNALSFLVNIKDNNALVAFSDGALKAVLYDGFRIVAEKDLALGDNAVTFEGLATNTLYQYAIVGYYDDLSGKGFEMNLLLKDAFYTDSVVLFKDVAVGQESVSFSFLWHEDHGGKALSALKLYKGESLVREVAVDAATVTGLLSDTCYTLVAEYPNAGSTERIVLEFTTNAKAMPEISVINPTKTQTSVGFEIAETDADSVGAVTKIELVHKSGTTAADSLDERSFAGLLSNNAYTVKVTYVYDLGDGEGEHTVTRELAITTEAKAVPSFAVMNPTITTTAITAEYDLTDIDNILSDYKVELYHNGTLVAENSGKKIAFSGLSYYTDYTVRFTYKYDLNDGNGEQIATYDYNCKTLPYINVTECEIANTSAVSEGETIYMSVKLDNPLEMSISSVVINGESYGVTGASTKNKIFVEITYNGQFVGGDTSLQIDRVNATLDAAPFAVEPATTLSDNVFINGKVEVLKIELVNKDFEAVDWAFPSEKVYVLITLDNPTGYTVDNINGSITTLFKLDDNRWYYETALSTGWNTLSLTSLTYSNAYISGKTLTYSDKEDSIYCVASDTVHYITTPDDLMDMYDGYYYELTGDIDLSGLEWQGAAFYGVFNGKGYSIKNMSFVGTVKNADAHLGLFRSGNGVIQNVKIEEATLIADVIRDDGNGYSAYAGGLVARTSGNLVLQGCAVDEYTVISLNNSVGDAYVGGLVGNAYGDATVTITNCTNSGDVSATSSSAYVGGLVGRASSITVTGCTNSGDVSAISASDGAFAGGLVGRASSITVTGCTNSGDVSAISTSSAYAGGLVGYTDSSSSTIITDCTNSGDVSAISTSDGAFAGGLVGYTYYSATVTITGCTNSGDVSATAIYARAGGLVGYTVSSSSTIITDCTNSGDVSATSTSSASAYAGGIVGLADYDATITVENSYSLFQGNGKENGTPCTPEQLNSKAFYTDTLGWSEDVWDFSELDVANGKIPVLK